MKKYTLSSISSSFIHFLNLKNIKHDVTEDGKAIYVWFNCDQDLFDLGKLYKEYSDAEWRYGFSKPIRY